MKILCTIIIIFIVSSVSAVAAYVVFKAATSDNSNEHYIVAFLRDERAKDAEADDVQGLTLPSADATGTTAAAPIKKPARKRAIPIRHPAPPQPSASSSNELTAEDRAALRTSLDELSSLLSSPLLAKEMKIQ